MVVLALCFGWWVDHSALRTINAHLGKVWTRHLIKEHPGQAEYERLMSELIVPDTNSN